MVRYILKRLGQGLLSLAIITLVIFLLTRLLGDPILRLLPQTYTQAEYDALEKALGYDQTAWVQFLNFLGDLIRGDLGNSIVMSQPVTEVLAARLPVTGTLTLISVTIGLALALLVGFAAAYGGSRMLDSTATFLATLGSSIPSFAIGLMLIVVFAVWMGAFPAGGWGTWDQMVLPVITLTVWMFANTVRIARSAMQERVNQQYVTLARTKGLSSSYVLLRHAVRPSLPPVVSYAAVLAGSLFSGAMVTETLFGIPGIGSLAVEAVNNRDQPLVIGIVMISALIFILLNLVADIVSAFLDPRVRLEGGAK